MKLIIDIPKGTYEAVKVGTINQVLEYKVWDAIKDGTPLDDVITKIDETYDDTDGYDPYALGTFANKVSEILDNIGKAESEDKPNETNNR